MFHNLEIPKYRKVISDITLSYIGKEELERFAIYSDIDTHVNQIILIIWGKHDIQSRAILNMDEVILLPPDQVNYRVSYFVKEAYNAYVNERIKCGFIPLETLRSKKGVFE